VGLLGSHLSYRTCALSAVFPLIGLL